MLSKIISTLQHNIEYAITMAANEHNLNIGGLLNNGFPNVKLCQLSNADYKICYSSLLDTQISNSIFSDGTIVFTKNINDTTNKLFVELNSKNVKFIIVPVSTLSYIYLEETQKISEFILKNNISVLNIIDLNEYNLINYNKTYTIFKDIIRWVKDE